jgi:hypothetical protein
MHTAGNTIMIHDDKHKNRIGGLQDEIKHRDRRIEELRAEIDEQRDLIHRLREKVEEGDEVIERWCESFGMRMTDDGAWTWEPFWDEHWQNIDDYDNLVRLWNKYLPLISGRMQPVGRALAASEAQVAEALRLRKRGRSLRGIAEDLTLGLNTVRTIISKGNGTDRATRKHRQRLERVELGQQMAHWKRQRRTGNALPRQVQRVVEEGRALIKEAKGLGRAK